LTFNFVSVSFLLFYLDFPHLFAVMGRVF
jgi:hypothetical protein